MVYASNVSSVKCLAVCEAKVQEGTVDGTTNSKYAGEAEITWMLDGFEITLLAFTN